MGERELVTEIREVVNKIKLEKGNINLFMLLGDEESESEDSFTLLISAKWLDDLSPREGIGIIVEYLINNLTDEEMNGISRITAVSTKDPSVMDITRNLRCNGGISWNYGCRFGNVYIPFAVILESNFYI
ncbi:hypothetical protein ACX16Y_28035 [Bacillus cereus]|uniref:hypothetical protein n=1 Tax=Bacillus sp. HSTU-bmb18 TaxID=2755318 RepID=UPI0034C646EE